MFFYRSTWAFLFLLPFSHKSVLQPLRGPEQSLGWRGGLVCILEPRRGEEGIHMRWPRVGSQSPSGVVSAPPQEESLGQGAGTWVGKGGDPGVRLSVRLRGASRHFEGLVWDISPSGVRRCPWAAGDGGSDQRLVTHGGGGSNESTH